MNGQQGYPVHKAMVDTLPYHPFSRNCRKICFKVAEIFPVLKNTVADYNRMSGSFHLDL